jgi:hypothetical protein
MGFLKRGPNWDQTPPAAELQELGKGHMAHLRSMHQAGHLVLARLSQFEAILGYFEMVLDRKSNSVNTEVSKSGAVKTYPLP